MVSACSDLVAPQRYQVNLSDCPNCSSEEIQRVWYAIGELRQLGGDCERAANDLEWHMWEGTIAKYQSTSFGQTGPSHADTIYISDRAFNAGELANTLSHEESHHWGYHHPDHPAYNPTENATSFGDSCDTWT